MSTPNLPQFIWDRWDYSVVEVLGFSTSIVVQSDRDWYIAPIFPDYLYLTDQKSGQVLMGVQSLLNGGFWCLNNMVECS